MSSNWYRYKFYCGSVPFWQVEIDLHGNTEVVSDHDDYEDALRAAQSCKPYDGEKVWLRKYLDTVADGMIRETLIASSEEMPFEV